MNNTEHSCSNTRLASRCLDEIDSAGEILKVCREEKGLSLDEVSEELKILKRNLSLLEHDQAHEQLTLLFAKGYLKNYAQFLGLDAKLLESKWRLSEKTGTVDNIENAEIADSGNSKMSIKTESKSLKPTGFSAFWQKKNKKANHKAYYGVGAVVAIMAGALWLNTDPVLHPSDQPNQVTVETPKGVTTELLAEESEKPQPIVVTPEMTDDERASLVAKLRQDYNEFKQGYRNLNSDVSNSDVSIESASDKPLAAVVSYSPDSLDQQDETILTAGETGISTMLTPESRSELAFFFSDDCWIKVVDGQNRIVYEAVAKQNESLELEGLPPFKVTLGYAPAVQVSYNGEPVEINTRQGKNVARIVLGS